MRGKEAKGGEGKDENITISVHLRAIARVYLDKVPARNRLKSESMPTMKGVKRCCADGLVAIKLTYKTIIAAVVVVVCTD